VSAPEKIFKGDLTKIGAVDIEAPLATAKTSCCEYYMSQYANAAQNAEEKKDEVAASVYRFLQIITSFYPSFDTPHQPFRPFFQMEDRRGFIPSDLWPEDIAAIKELTKFAKDCVMFLSRMAWTSQI
jgi:hypothetical protein